jgi:hypothetical protein
MSFKSIDAIFHPDPRFADLCGVKSGAPRPMTLNDLHGWIAEIDLVAAAPTEVHDAFDRARNLMVYAFFDYELLVVGAVQACSALELALKHRLNGHGGHSFGALGKLVTRARSSGILPSAVANPHVLDPIDAVIAVRNGLAHGTSDIHSPAMAIGVLSTCASWINHIFSQQQVT